MMCPCCFHAVPAAFSQRSYQNILEWHSPSYFYNILRGNAVPQVWSGGVLITAATKEAKCKEAFIVDKFCMHVAGHTWPSRCATPGNPIFASIPTSGRPAQGLGQLAPDGDPQRPDRDPPRELIQAALKIDIRRCLAQ